CLTSSLRSPLGTESKITPPPGTKRELLPWLTAIHFPSGDQSAVLQSPSSSASIRSGPPSAGTMKRPFPPFSCCAVNAIDLPSGDQAGAQCVPGSEVSLRGGPPSISFA